MVEARAKRVEARQRERTRRLLIRRGHIAPNDVGIETKRFIDKHIELENARNRKGLLGRIFRRG